MTSQITLSDLVIINKQIGEAGALRNKSALEYSIDQANSLRGDAFFKQLAYVARALLLDHAFVEGNKRTFTCFAVMLLRENKIELETDKMWKLMDCIYRITTKQVTNIGKIRLMLINHLSR